MAVHKDRRSAALGGPRHCNSVNMCFFFESGGEDRGIHMQTVD